MSDFKVFSNEVRESSVLPTLPSMALPAVGANRETLLAKYTHHLHSYRYLIYVIVAIAMMALFLFQFVVKPSVGKTPEEMVLHVDSWIQTWWKPVQKWIGGWILRGYLTNDGAIQTTHLPPDSVANQFISKLNIAEVIQPI